MRLSLIAAIILFTGSAQSAIIEVNSNDTIQAAIDKAQEADLIEVQSGTYYENIDVNKRIHLKGIGNPIINARKKENGIILSANGIVLEGFSIVNAKGSGINVKSNNNDIKANTVSGNIYGIQLYDSNDNTISNNTVKYNDNLGIILENSSNNQLIKNIVSNSNESGIVIHESHNNLLLNNIVAKNNPKRDMDMPHTVTFGIFLDNSWSNNIKENNVEDNMEGISIRTYEPRLTSEGSINNNISLNTIKNNEDGIVLSYSDRNRLYKNIISNSIRHCGLSLNEANYNEILENNVINNLNEGIVIEGSNNAIHNNIINYNGKDALVVYGTNNTIISNELNHNGESGIHLGDNSKLNIVERNNVAFNMEFGIVADWKSKGNILNNNNIQNNGLEWNGAPNFDNGFVNSCDTSGTNWWDGIPKRICTWKTPNLRNH